MLISIETHRTCDFPGGGHFIASPNIKVFGRNIASVANWVLGSFSYFVYALLTFLKKLLLVTEKTSTSGYRRHTCY